MQETRVPSLGREDALEKGLTTHAGILAGESKGPGGARPLPRQPSEAVPWGQAGPPGPAAPSPSSTSPSRLQVASRCSSSCRLRAQSLVTLRISSRRAWLAELAWSSCSLSSAFTWARLALLGGAEESRWVPGQRAAGPRAPPAGPPLLLLLQADEGALQVLAVPCVLRGTEAGRQTGQGRKGQPCPPGAHPQPQLLQLCASLQQLLLRLRALLLALENLGVGGERVSRGAWGWGRKGARGRGGGPTLACSRCTSCACRCWPSW